MKNLYIAFRSYRFIFDVIEREGGRPNTFVEFSPIGSCGHHVKVYRNNLMIGDYIHKNDAPVSTGQAHKYVEMAYTNPVDYSGIWTPVED